jgi:predicted pyridoxine 5'-phosphate oxidase superfamily flavin-nucleotide-binding protein
VLDDKTIAYADFRGNRQYISSGNLTVNDKVSLILMDYPNQRRLKIMGRAKQIDQTEDPKLVSSLEMPDYRAVVERAVLIKIEAFDWNCPKHIPQRLTLQEFEPHISTLHQQIVQLVEENTALKIKLESIA